jgi:predicted alpha-1,2-mannosidase
MNRSLGRALMVLFLGCAACGSNSSGDQGPGDDASAGSDSTSPGMDSGGSRDSGGSTDTGLGSDSGGSGTDSGLIDSGGGGNDSGPIDSGVTTDSGDSGGDAGPWVPDPASLVNTTFGTAGGGNTFPGPDVPFGMVQWSPDTSPDRNPGGGYNYSDSQLRGFSLTHVSGPGCGAYGDIPIIPLTGGLPTGDPGSFLQPFTHTGEVAEAGYYSVQLGPQSALITTELTATKRSAMARFTFPTTSTANDANLILKLLDSQTGSINSSATIVSNNEVQGSTTSGFFCGAGDQYTLYFDIVFDQPFTSSSILKAGGGTLDGVVFLTFDSSTHPIVQAKVGISWVSAANAAGNWAADNPNPTWNFASIKASAHDAWNSVLDQIQIAGGTLSDQQLFYTAFYHSLLHPNVFSDSNGQYMGFDNTVHTVSGSQKDQYANYSGWDIYHSQVQLSAMVAPQQMSDSAQSMLNDAAQNGGQLPKWALANGETYIMVGDPADGILAGYYAFGATGFDTATALADMIKEATVANNIRPGLDYYQNLGYLPDDGTYGCCNFYGSVSTLLEYAQADFALSQFASALGDTTNATKFLARAQNWQNVFDPVQSLFTPRLLNGSFVSGIGPTSTQGMVEGSTEQYSWAQPFNRQALTTAMGGPTAVNTALTSYFSALDSCSFNSAQACFANEMDLGEQYWNDYTGQAYNTQSVVNRIRTTVFSPTPAYFDNNDDLGAESSMLVWSMLGLYPDYPGSAIMTLNAPQFPNELIHLPGGKTIAINAPGANASTLYVQALLVNGAASTKPWLDASFMQSGGTLDFTMGSTPSMSWGSAPTDAPPSFGATAAIGFTQTNALSVPPGGQATVTIGAQSTRSDVPQTVSWQLALMPSAGADAGGPLAGSFSLAAGGRQTQQVNFTAPTTQGPYTLPLQLGSSLGVPAPGPSIALVVASPGVIWPYFNNAGISDDTTGLANFDGSGYSYSAQALATAGATPGNTVTVGSVKYTWPPAMAAPLDDLVVGGQVITFAEAAAKTTISILGCATDAATTGATADVVVTYADGGTQHVNLVFSDWTLNGGSQTTPVAGDTIALTTAYRDDGKAMDNTKTYVFSFTAALSDSTAAASPVQTVSLPTTTSGGTIHIFDIEIE